MSVVRAAGECPPAIELERLAAGAGSAEVQEHVRQCAACAAQLEEIGSANRLLEEFAAVNAETLTRAGPALHHAAPPGYEIESEIHRGSQGVVYRAVQRSTRRTVALKVMLGGAFATERERVRFEREAEVVASLRHPNVVTVHDSGVTPEGRPFIAMEYVAGVPLDDWAASVRGGAAVRSRSALRDSTIPVFLAICRGVAAAHARGVIHRDLKPGNVIVDGEGVPHVVDFGLAKFVGPEAVAASPGTTRPGEFLGTFAYASPEQVAGDPALIDVRSDLYSLGVMLYELLSGRPPYELRGSLADVVRTIAEGAPVPLERTAPSIGEDLAAIAHQALAKEPERRYQSVAALAEDLERWRRGLPVSARGDDRWYVLRRTLARHRSLVAAAIAAFAVLGAFSATMWVLYGRATDAEEEALHEADRAARTLGSYLALIGRLDQEDPTGPAGLTTVGDLLDEAARIVDVDLADLPEVSAPVRSELGLAYLSKSMFDEASHHLRRALDGYRALHGDDHPDVARALHDLGRLHFKTGPWEEAERYYREALAMRLATHGADDARTAETRQHLASTLRRRGALAEAEALHRDALATRLAILAQDHPEIANSLNGLGVCLLDQGRAAEAAECFRSAWERVAARPGADEQARGGHSRTNELWEARAMHNLASALVDLGALEEAAVLATRSRALKRRHRAEDDPDVASADYELARIALASGDLERANALARSALAVREAQYGPDHPDRADSLALVALVERARGRPLEAAALLAEARASIGRGFGETHWKVAEVRAWRAACLLDAGREAEARAELDAAARWAEGSRAAAAVVAERERAAAR